jgi:putative Mg2+ transporter-C (MgtC) family protein
MTAAFVHLVQPLSFDWFEQLVVAHGAVGRLLLACALGGLIGLERELRHKSAGVRTNLLISMGSAFFTLLSAVVAGDLSSNKAQIASNIVQGIGFLGAGLILHNRNRISGLASAASVWAVASIGMACGAGLYAVAALAAFIVLIAMELVGFFERYGNIKPFLVTYEARGSDALLITQSILAALDKERLRLADLETTSVGDLQRVTFPLAATNRQHERLRRQLPTQPGISNLFTFRDPEDD